MRGSGAAIFPMLLLGLLTALTFWLEQATQSGPFGDGKRRHDPDFIVDNFRVRRFDIDGLLQHTLVAKRMQHYPDDDSTDVFEPKVTYHRVPSAVVTADTAWLDSKGEHVRLSGNVKMVRDSERGVAPTIITTSTLFVVPDDETARTDAPVTITKGYSIVTGSNLKVDNQEQISVLSGPVRGTIYRNSSSKPVPPAPKSNERTSNLTSPSAVRSTATAAPDATAAAPAKPAVRAKPGARGKGGQGKTRKSGSRPNHG